MRSQLCLHCHRIPLECVFQCTLLATSIGSHILIPHFESRCKHALQFPLIVKDLKYPPRGMENQTNPASWPWFQLMNDAIEGRLVGKAPKITPIWVSDEDYLFASSPPPAERDCPIPERSGISVMEEGMGTVDTERDGTVTYIDASGEECPTPVEFSYKSQWLSSFILFLNVLFSKYVWCLSSLHTLSSCSPFDAPEPEIEIHVLLLFK